MLIKHNTLEEQKTMESKTTYFENIGKENTEQTLSIAKHRANELGVKTVVIASTTGETAVKALDVFYGLNLIVVSHTAGFKNPDIQEFTEENRKIVEGKGVPIVTSTHVFGGLDRAMRQGSIPETRFTYVIGDIVAATLGIFGHGMKVACEIAVMAADAGLVRCDEDIISVAGTGAIGGSDTAIIIQPANAHRFFDIKVKEILCKPRRATGAGDIFGNKG